MRQSEERIQDSFLSRHIGPNASEVAEMLAVTGGHDLEDLVAKIVPREIKIAKAFAAPPFEVALSEAAALDKLRALMRLNIPARSLIGMGYHGTITPSVIQRNILENPGWYTQYTPYQPEISQGRLEALLNFQTMVSDLTALPVSNASLLDEGTAAAEAMTMSLAASKKDQNGAVFLVAETCHPQTIAVVETRAHVLGIKTIVAAPDAFVFDDKVFGVLFQNPDTYGKIADLRPYIEKAHAHGALVTVAADPLALALMTPPGEMGADIAVGSTQRFGVPLGYGGPHAAYFATKDEYKRLIPGRIVGISKDSSGRPALRLALQTREQHIRREKATSNICTAQVLLAVMAGMYAVYHGAEGVRRIARRINELTGMLASGLRALGVAVSNDTFFDTLHVSVKGEAAKNIVKRAAERSINLRQIGAADFGITLDELSSPDEVGALLEIFGGERSGAASGKRAIGVPENLERQSAFFTHEVFLRYRSETEFLRYVRRLESRDLSLTSSMIPLGSCTMKLNATSEMFPVSWPEVGGLHPFAPLEQAQGYAQMFADLESLLAAVTGFDAVSLQPNAGSQGEYAGLLAIRAYLDSKGQRQRTVCLIPKSAHGTNPASAVMAGMRVVVVECDEDGNVDVADLKKKAAEHANDLAALMVTYPSTHGVFEEAISEVCRIVHEKGGQVYLDGANLNALVGLAKPGEFGADVCHINLHKTFCIPHGGGGPGMGPIGVRAHLKDFLPSHPCVPMGGKKSLGPVSAAPWGSASILVIPWMYCCMMGAEGLRAATNIAILNANYIAKRLEKYFCVLYRGKNGYVAHECILDLRELKKTSGVEVEDVAKRLMDYGFHAPTVSFPVAGTLMVEPTESESKQELDEFCEAMIAIWHEIKAVETGKSDKLINPLKLAPHTAETAVADSWDRPYSRETAVFPSARTKRFKFWPSVGRIDGVYGDKNLVCSCAPIDSYK